MEYILGKWDAIEIFSKIASKAGQIPLKDFRDEKVIASYLKLYANRTSCKAVSDEIFDSYEQHIIEKRKAELELKRARSKKTRDISDFNDRLPQKKVKPHLEMRRWSRFIYNFGAAIRTGKPVILSGDQLDACLHYIGEEKFQVTEKQKITPFTPDTKRQKLYSTKWSLYFVDDRPEADVNQNAIRQSLSRALLTLSPFGKAVIVRGLPNKGKEKRIYEGSFDLYDNNYLLISARIKGYDRDLRLIFYLGSLESMELAVGLASNTLDYRFFSQKILIEPYNKVNEKESIPDFHEFASNSPVIPSYVWKYFGNQDSNIITLPTGINKPKELTEWLDKLEK